jgi:hypothetical protein
MYIYIYQVGWMKTEPNITGGITSAAAEGGVSTANVGCEYSHWLVVSLSEKWGMPREMTNSGLVNMNMMIL